jgi:hypothetical protein
MVEKTVSRDIQELVLKEGCTLILDMKLSRLQRIARCTGSPIISFPEVLDNPKLKQCDYFHTEKFVEEHNSASEGGKRLSKTLMFLEGFPRPLGCTVCLLNYRYLYGAFIQLFQINFSFFFKIYVGLFLSYESKMKIDASFSYVYSSENFLVKTCPCMKTGPIPKSYSSLLSTCP